MNIAIVINIGCCDYNQLTPEAERKVEQSRELLDTIVNEKKGKQVMLHLVDSCVHSCVLS